MKNILIAMAAVLCCFISVNAQTTETESNAARYLRLCKEADENPSDWKAQMVVVHILTDKNSGFYNQQRAARYLERIYHTAINYNKEVPDSVLRESLFSLAALANDKKDIDKAMFYLDELKHANKVGVDMGEGGTIALDVMSILLHMMKNDMLQALCTTMNMRHTLTDNNMQGIEYSDVFTAMLFENVIDEYLKMFGDKLPEVTMDGKKYIIIAMGKWNIGNPLMGWMSNIFDDDNNEKGNLKLFYGEDGKVYDGLHGEISYSFNSKKDGLIPQEGNNTRLITVSEEQRQQMVEAYHKFLKKNDKNKK
jgi:hypothetical protein